MGFFISIIRYHYFSLEDRNFYLGIIVHRNFYLGLIVHHNFYLGDLVFDTIR